jgi:hypothetical protein
VHPCWVQLVKGATRTVTELTRGHITTPSSEAGAPIGAPIPPDDQTHVNCQLDDPDQNPQEAHQIALPDDLDDLCGDPNTSTSQPGEVLPQNALSPQSLNPATMGSAPVSQSPATTQQQPRAKVKVGTKIRYKDYKDLPWQEATISSRAGKATGVNRNWWNTTQPDGTSHAVNLDEVYEWNINDTDITQDGPDLQNNPDTQESLVCDNLLATNKSRELEAKLAELDQWKSMGVYEEIEDNGQECLSLRWVVKDKLSDEGVQVCKARLCVRGFEEETNFRTDSPTCSREGIRLFLSTTASRKWKIHSMDVKGAFLQGKEMQREVFIRPPREAKTQKIWKLRKCAYGLADAPRCWYLRIREELLQLGATPSKFDNGIFIFHSTVTQGIVILHVDDIMWAGNEGTMLPIMNKLKRVFQISHEDEEAFTYIGIHTTQLPNGSITLDQKSYINSIEEIPLAPERARDLTNQLHDKEITALRSVLGQLNWVSNMTRPDISYGVSRISGHIKHATIADIKEANKIVKHVKSETTLVSFPPLDIESTQVVAFTDSSFNNLEDGGSQGGHVVFLKDKHNRSCPISWRSQRVRRVARSTLAAESLSFADGVDAAAFVSSLAAELQATKWQWPVIGVTDSRSLFDAASTSTQITDRRLRVEISAIRDSKERGELEVIWTSADNQLADVLTKKGASSYKLLSAVTEGRIHAQGYIKNKSPK